MGEIVNGLWIRGNLSAMELLTISSYFSNGFIFRLWTYEPKTINAPANTIVMDAAEILPSEKIFTYRNTNIHGHGKNSYAGFSDIFRYKLLYEHGGFWTDMDITCLKAFEIKDDYFFRYHHKAGAVGNFMKCPQHAPLMKWCYEQASAQVDEHNKNWMLPIELLNEGISRFQLKNFIHKISNNDSFPEVTELLSTSRKLPASWMIIHWMNEEWRRFNLQKDTALPGSVYAMLLEKYGIPVSPSPFLKMLNYRIKIHRLYYFLVCYYYIYKYKLKSINS